MFNSNIYNNSVSNLTNNKAIINGKEVNYFGNFCKIDQKLIVIVRSDLSWIKMISGTKLCLV